MAYSKEYLEYVLDQLHGAGPIETRRLFGGMGLYTGGAIFGFVMEDALYLKVDETTRAQFQDRGSVPFNPPSMRSTKGMPYMTVPEDVLEDPQDLVAWTRQAIEIGLKTKRRP